MVNYPGVEDMKLDPKQNIAIVRFTTNEQAKLGLSGNSFYYVSNELIDIGLNKFRIDQQGRELKVSFI